uniref:ATP synthase F0 subunit 6 n=1 Tax=Heptathela kimurai TaxID=88333 RepID=UPI0031F38F29
MMTNLFSIFDPISSFNLSLNWLSIILFIMIMPTPMFFLLNTSMAIYMKTTYFIHNEFKLLTYPNHQGSILFFFSIFMLILSMNTMGLFPSIFTPSSHLMVTLSLSLTIWTTIILSNLIMSPKMMMAHLVPQGTPMFLSFFMVIIETISNIIRPMTLAVRLAANMIAGHLLLSLVSSIASLQILSTTISISLQFLLILLETAVALIQAFVFTILSLLYSTE